ncbi:hypothetical protein [Phreatobacter oligotrophus]|jgi:hypothetical protein|uniref:Uncharacterized protein n=1 Tax=Phreatobacter oligotrophus TaxID=1122261 RepID=A0A2T4ZGL3_9HYPH|nr:hypothetical protein [Phreatobacter oligotrophus]MBX9991090.1 hypothetical protein [Phreatobacter oligotrophus]PTM61058.1 hypothetical protein C8P69_102444 [Phreatobacter oligotrophus]
MATIALDKIAATAPAEKAVIATKAAGSTNGKPGFWRSLYNSIVEAQELRAATYVHGYLAHLSDDELARHGMTRDQMIRRTRSMMASV